MKSLKSAVLFFCFIGCTVEPTQQTKMEGLDAGTVAECKTNCDCNPGSSCVSGKCASAVVGYCCPGNNCPNGEACQFSDGSNGVCGQGGTGGTGGSGGVGGSGGSGVHRDFAQQNPAAGSPAGKQ